MYGNYKLLSGELANTGRHTLIINIKVSENAIDFYMIYRDVIFSDFLNLGEIQKQKYLKVILQVNYRILWNSHKEHWTRLQERPKHFTHFKILISFLLATYFVRNINAHNHMYMYSIKL